MSKITNITFTNWESTTEMKAIAAVLQKDITDATIEEKNTIKISSSSCINDINDLEKIAVDMAVVAKDSRFEIRGTYGIKPFLIYYENHILYADFDVRYKVPLPEGLITVDDLCADLEEYAETAGFADYYNRVLKNWSEEQIRDSHTEIFESDI